MIQCELIPASATAGDYICRADCGRASQYVLKAQDYSYSYPCCAKADCQEKVKATMEQDIARALKKGSLVKEPRLPSWRWFPKRKSTPFDPYLT